MSERAVRTALRILGGRIVASEPIACTCTADRLCPPCQRRRRRAVRNRLTHMNEETDR